MPLHRVGICAAALVLSICATARCARALDEIWIVRHAEKAESWSENPELDVHHPLSEAGVARAERIAEWLADVPITVVLASPTTRALHTGLATALAHEVELRAAAESVDPARIEGWVAGLRAEFPGPGAALIVGHSNTVPWLLEVLGAVEGCHERLGIGEESYGPAIEGHDGLWQATLARPACDGIVRHQVP